MAGIFIVAPDSRLQALREALERAGVGAHGTPDPTRISELTGEGPLPRILVAAGELQDDPKTREALLDDRWLPVLLGHPSEVLDGEAPDQLRVVDAGIDDDELATRLTFGLLGLEIGLAPDADLAHLVADAAHNAVLDVVRRLCRHGIACEVALEGGSIRLGGGDVLAARSLRATGIKAFCRLARRRTGTLIVRRVPVAPREIGMELEQLLLRALEDAQELPPDPRSALRPFQAGLHRAAGLLDYQRELLHAIDEAPTVADLLDALTWPDGLIARRLSRMVEAGLVEVVKPRNPTVVLTDSTADLPARLTRRLGIDVVPLSVLFGTTTYLDGVGILPASFYELSEKRTELPRAVAPEVDSFAVAFAARLADQDVVAVHLSSKLSTTFDHSSQGATLALEASPRPGARIELVDGGNVSAGTGLLARAAARMAERGLDVAEIAARLRAMAPRIHTLFVVDNLDSLVRGGRIREERGLVGKLLGIKPILGVVGGEIVTVDKVRGGRTAPLRMIELIAQRVDPSQRIVAAVAHSKAPVLAERLRGLLSERFDLGELVVVEVGPAIATHVGAGAVGITVLQPSAEEWELVQPGLDEIDADPA